MKKVKNYLGLFIIFFGVISCQKKNIDKSSSLPQSEMEITIDIATVVA